MISIVAMMAALVDCADEDKTNSRE